MPRRKSGLTDPIHDVHSAQSVDTLLPVDTEATIIEFNADDTIERMLVGLYCVGDQSLADTLELLRLYRASRKGDDAPRDPRRPLRRPD